MVTTEVRLLYHLHVKLCSLLLFNATQFSGYIISRHVANEFTVRFCCIAAFLVLNARKEVHFWSGEHYFGCILLDG